jgi:hypothetical protein
MAVSALVRTGLELHQSSLRSRTLRYGCHVWSQLRASFNDSCGSCLRWTFDMEWLRRICTTHMYIS